MNKISYNYLTPNYESIANLINKINNTKYASRIIRYIHSGKSNRYNSILLLIDDLVGSYSQWHDNDGKTRFIGDENQKIDYIYLTPNYHQIAAMINMVHSTNYTNRQIKFIHKGKHKRTEKTIKIEIDSFVGCYKKWFDENNKKRGFNE